MTSASPLSIMRADRPMACRPVVQAVTTAMLGPLKPYLIDTWPEIMLMIDAGTKNGEMRRGPRLTISLCVSSIIGSPPMPEPMFTPMRVASSSPSASPVGSPLSSTAWHGRGQPEVDEAVHVPGFLLGDVVADLEALDLARELAGQVGGVELT
jgi:hypothetical protein